MDVGDYSEWILEGIMCGKVIKFLTVLVGVSEICTARVIGCETSDSEPCDF